MNGTYEQCIELPRAIAGTVSTPTKGTISTSTNCLVGVLSFFKGNVTRSKTNPVPEITSVQRFLLAEDLSLLEDLMMNCRTKLCLYV